MRIITAFFLTALYLPGFTIEIIDPQTTNIDYLTQGEFLGYNTDSQVIGIQVRAEGKGKFSAVIYQGGLPGQGWMPGDRKDLTSGSFDNQNRVQFNTNESQLILDGDELSGQTPSGLEITTERVNRKSPTLGMAPPEGAILLFDSASAQASLTEHWNQNGLDGNLLIEGNTTKTRMKSHFLHLEFRTPFKSEARGQQRGNSGLYIHGRHEIQILDSYSLDTAHNRCGGVYSKKSPDVNMTLPPLRWQTYDVKVQWDPANPEEATLTVYHNGRLIHDHFFSNGTAGGKGEVTTEGGIIYLQDHANPVRFRNIWFVEDQDIQIPNLPENPEYLLSTSGIMRNKTFEVSAPFLIFKNDNFFVLQEFQKVTRINGQSNIIF